MHDAHGVQSDVDAAGLGRHGRGVVVDGAFVQGVDPGDVCGVSDVAGDSVQLGPRSPGEKDAGAFSSTGASDGAADRATASVDQGVLVLQQHRGLLRVISCRTGGYCSMAKVLPSGSLNQATFPSSSTWMPFASVRSDGSSYLSKVTPAALSSSTTSSRSVTYQVATVPAALPALVGDG